MLYDIIFIFTLISYSQTKVKDFLLTQFTLTSTNNSVQFYFLSRLFPSPTTKEVALSHILYFVYIGSQTLVGPVFDEFGKTKQAEPNQILLAILGKNMIWVFSLKFLLIFLVSLYVFFLLPIVSLALLSTYLISWASTQGKFHCFRKVHVLSLYWVGKFHGKSKTSSTFPLELP